MSTEQPNANTIKVANPPIEDNARSYLTQDVDASAPSVSIASTSGFDSSGGFYVLFGVYGDEKAEISRVTAISGKTLSVATLKNSHEASDPITLITFNKINIYGLTASDGTPSATPTATVDIDPTSQITEYVYNDTVYTFFSTAYYNSEDDEISGYSEIFASSSFTRRSAERIIKSGAIKALTRIDENPDARLSWETALTILQDGLDEISARKKRWPFWKTITSGDDTVSDTQYISKPNDLTQLIRIKIDGEVITWMDDSDYAKYTTGTALRGIPSNYTEKAGAYYLYPTPSSAYSVEYEYYKTPDVISNMSTEIDIPLVPVLIYYCGAQFAYLRGNESKGDSLYQMYIRLLEDQVEEYSGPDQDGTPEYVTQNSALNDDNLIY